MSRIDPTAISTDRLSWAAGVVIGASLPHWLQLPFWIPVFLIACIAWRFGARFGYVPVPSRIVRIILAMLLFFSVLFSYRTINGVNAGSALLVVMVALKFLECHTQRDQIVLTIISYFLVFASVLYGGGIGVGIYLVAFVWISTVGLLQLGRGGRLLPTGQTVRFAGRLLLQSTPVMIVLFLLFPRLPGPLWGLPGDTSSGASGLSGEMSPGDITELGLSDEIAFRVDFYSGAPSPSDLYWRGPVLSNFNGRTWSREVGMRRRPTDSLEFSGDPVNYFIALEPTTRPWLVALEMAAEWNSNSRRRTITMGSDYQLRMFGAENLTRGIDYTVTSYTEYSAREPLTPAQQASFTRLPDDLNPRTRALAAGWLEETSDPREIVQRAFDFLQQGEFFYTLTPPALGRDTADEFLFETREGFCEHYASAFAIMLRAAGIPTRVVTGYQGGELSPLGRYYIVRQSDAHAWTEVWLEDAGWVRMDPITAVAPERIALGLAGSEASRQSGREGLGPFAWTRQLMLAWDSVNVFWERWVVGYGFQLQRALIEQLGFDRPSRAQLMSATIIATVAMMIVLSAYLTVRFRRDRHRDAAASQFHAFNRMLKRHRIEPIRAGETPTRYAARAAESWPEAAPTIQAVVNAYLQARYEPDPAGTAIGQLRDLVRGFNPRSVPASP